MAREVAVPLEFQEEAPERPRLRHRLLFIAKQHPLGVFGLFCVFLFLFAGIFADVIAPYDPLDPNRHTVQLGRLTDPISATDTKITVANLKADPGTTLFIGDEQISLLPDTSFATNSTMTSGPVTVTVLRGRNSTHATDHPSGALLEDVRVDKLSKPSLKHPFGTDVLGRDVMSRTIFGARISLLIGVIAIGFGITIGTFFGVVSGYFGGIIDSIIQRLVDMLLAFPAVVLLLLIVAVIGDEDSAVRQFLADNTPIPEGSFLGLPNFLQIFVVALGIGVAVSVGTARIVRGAVLSTKENVYIEAARAMGASDTRIMWRHIFPNVAALVVILASVFLPIAILAEAAISFLGIGVPTPVPSWGADLTRTNRDPALQGYWWPVFFPGLALSLVVLGFNLLGDTFRDISDPRLRGGLGSGPGSTRGTGF